MREKIEKLLKVIKDYIHNDCNIEINVLNKLNSKLSEHVDFLKQAGLLLENEYEEAQSEIVKLKSLLKYGWYNPYSWNIYKRDDFSTVITTTGKTLHIPPNTLITINDRKIKANIISYNLKKVSCSLTAYAIINFLKKRITYVYDHQNSWTPKKIENFQSASFTQQSRSGDCDDMAILFQTYMHICGFGDKSVCCVDKKNQTLWFNGKNISHVWNRVLINEAWINVDLNAAIFKEEANVTYPEMNDLSYWFNYWGAYK